MAVMTFSSCPRCAADVEIKPMLGYRLFGKCKICGLEYKMREEKATIHLQ